MPAEFFTTLDNSSLWKNDTYFVEDAETGFQIWKVGICFCWYVSWYLRADTSERVTVLNAKWAIFQLQMYIMAKTMYISIS